MSDNVIKFQRPKPPRQPRQVPPGLRKVLMIAGVIVAFALVYLYFSMTGTGDVRP